MNTFLIVLGIFVGVLAGIGVLLGYKLAKWMDKS